MTSTDKVIEILTQLKEAGLPDEALNQIGTKLGELQNTATLEASFRDPAGESEIHSFASAAHALTPLDEEMRQRALDALRALLLPREPSFLEKLAPGLEAVAQAVPSLLEAARTANGVPSAVPQGQPHDDAEQRAPFVWDEETPVSANVVRIAKELGPFKVPTHFTAATLSEFTGIPVDVILSDDQDGLPGMYRD